MKPTPKRQPDCRLSNLVLEGGRSKCYRPKEHRGDCGEPIDQEDTGRRDDIYFARCRIAGCWCLGLSPRP